MGRRGGRQEPGIGRRCGSPAVPCSLLQAEHQLCGGVCSPSRSSPDSARGAITSWGRRSKGPACQGPDRGSSDPVLAACSRWVTLYVLGSLLHRVSLCQVHLFVAWSGVSPQLHEETRTISCAQCAQCQGPYLPSRTFLASQPRKDWASWGSRVPVLLARFAVASPTWLLS